MQHYHWMYVHLVWSTKLRRPLIGSGLEERLYECIRGKCRELQCSPLAIGGVEDHVHLLVQLHPTVSVSQLVKRIKGASSRMASNEVVDPGDVFQWQRGYSVFSVGPRGLDAVTAYIQNQKEHHRTNELVPHWELGETIDSS